MQQRVDVKCLLATWRQTELAQPFSQMLVLRRPRRLACLQARPRDDQARGLVAAGTAASGHEHQQPGQRGEQTAACPRSARVVAELASGGGSALSLRQPAAPSAKRRNAEKHGTHRELLLLEFAF